MNTTATRLRLGLYARARPRGTAKVVYDKDAHKKAHNAVEYNTESKAAVEREKDANSPKAMPKAPPIITSKKSTLKEIEQKVLDFLKSLDHPATTNEVRDKFGFKLRADARRIFRKLQKLGYGENRKVGKRYLFYVKGKEYPPPPEAPSKAEKIEKTESEKA